jgi:hypothetical protein
VKYQLVMQVPEASLGYDDLVQLEDLLINELDDEADVDGHDVGCGEINFFILTNEPTSCFEKAKGLLSGKIMAEMRAAYREVGGEDYVVLWPPSLREFRVA